MDFVQILGFVGGALSTGAFLPQVWKTWTTKSTRDISLATMGVLAVSNYLWIVYGVLVSSPPLIVTNSATSAMITSLLVLKLRFG